MTRVTLLALALLALALSGCGSGTGGLMQPAAIVDLPLSNAGAAAGTHRWGDIAGNLYSSPYAATFTYDAPQVTVHFDDVGDGTLTGTLYATGLKPNFAYQLKLEGQPTVDPAANERIGYLGRWWSSVVNNNVTDAYYEANKGTEAIIGYLLFDFLITDGNGAATRSFRVDSSYHVVWNWAQPGAPRSSAGPKQYWAPVFGPAAYASSAGFNSRLQTLFPEIEPGRSTPGSALLPAGDYLCTIVMTEESFHGAYAGGGNWAAAVWNQALRFHLNAPAPVRDLAVTGLTTPARVSANKTCTVTVALANQGSVAEAAPQVSLRDGAAVVGTQTVGSLAAGATAGVGFRWTPNGKGAHLLSAEVAAVSGETDTADNVAAKTVQVK